MTTHVPPAGVTTEAHAAGLLFGAASEIHKAQLCLAHGSSAPMLRPTIEDMGAHREGLERLADNIRASLAARLP